MVSANLCSTFVYTRYGPGAESCLINNYFFLTTSLVNTTLSNRSSPQYKLTLDNLHTFPHVWTSLNGQELCPADQNQNRATQTLQLLSERFNNNHELTRSTWIFKKNLTIKRLNPITPTGLHYNLTPLGLKRALGFLTFSWWQFFW